MGEDIESSRVHKRAISMNNKRQPKQAKRCTLDNNYARAFDQIKSLASPRIDKFARTIKEAINEDFNLSPKRDQQPNSTSINIKPRYLDTNKKHAEIRRQVEQRM